MHVLNTFSEVKCLREPFNPENSPSSFHASIVDFSSLDKCLDQLWKIGNGIKHVWHPSGWPFQHKSLNVHLLQSDKTHIIFLRRRNILQRIVSSQISLQLNRWSFDFPQDRDLIQSFPFSPIDGDVVHWHLENELRLTSEVRKAHLVDCGAAFIDLWYEDLFGAAQSLASRQSKVAEIVDFLEIRTEMDSGSGNGSMVKRFLNPVHNKVNSVETYSRIPGIEEVERRFGCDTTGWLFK